MKTAIHTRYSGGAIIARADKAPSEKPFQFRMSYPHELPRGAKHPAAAKALAERLKWAGVWIVAGNADGSISCACLPHGVTPSSIAGHTLANHPLGVEGEDWFYVEESGK